MEDLTYRKGDTEYCVRECEDNEDDICIVVDITHPGRLERKYDNMREDLEATGFSPAEIQERIADVRERDEEESGEHFHLPLSAARAVGDMLLRMAASLGADKLASGPGGKPSENVRVKSNPDLLQFSSDDLLDELAARYSPIVVVYHEPDRNPNTGATMMVYRNATRTETIGMCHSVVVGTTEDILKTRRKFRSEDGDED